MGRFGLSALVGALAVLPLSAGALAADIPEIPPYVPPPIEVGHNWYLRGHIGLAAQHFSGLSHPAIDNAIATDAIFQWLDKGNFDGTPTFGIGIGYRHNDKLRLDLTGEYRSKADFSALDYYDVDGTPGGVDDGTNDYSGKKDEWLFLVNGYYDIGTWYGATPYVGAGVGFSYNTIYDFQDINTPNATTSYAPTGSMFNLAWALHAGIGIQATENLTIDLGYSFVSLGDAKTGILTATPGGCTFCAPMTFKNIYSHDFKLGVRYSFDMPKYFGPAVVKY